MTTRVQKQEFESLYKAADKLWGDIITIGTEKDTIQIFDGNDPDGSYMTINNDYWDGLLESALRLSSRLGSLRYMKEWISK